MADDITNKVLLEHMQGMKAELLELILDIKSELKEVKFELNGKIDTLEKKVDRGFEDARKHRQAIQEDLDASIVMLGKHQAKLEKVSV
ncbi:MAG: hypothetical protein QF741_00020 [Candidatus Peribacteraceae bacterium]|jgi:hypothetical protein|nr:hypothetical protein [Candidatus Peribacteraceae bacterium]MDP7454199.1 hypothetical protein [Candidatus Peribacteraceae bacterium]MDP7646263.1 hypothetical protein [Candidatus Peribacteraceae bacterium]|tara:strand:+ start:210 stop:473 length:264 start_codon:yes stop_codon:yes gene_type:complete